MSMGTFMFLCVKKTRGWLLFYPWHLGLPTKIVHVIFTVTDKESTLLPLRGSLAYSEYKMLNYLFPREMSFF